MAGRRRGRRALSRSRRRRGGGRSGYCPSGPKTRSAEVEMLQTCPLRSVMPLLSVISAGYWTPGVPPGLMVGGLAVIVIVSERPSKLRTQDAFVPQMMSAVVWGVQLAGGLDWFAGAPQSLSTTRIRADDEATVIALLKEIVIWSPVSRTPAK